jgi:hypothetical protein
MSATDTKQLLYNYNIPNAVVEWLTLLIRIKEVPGSYIGNPLSWGSSWFSLVSPRKYLDKTLN